MSPKLLKRLGLIIGIFVGIIVILFLFASCTKGGSSSKFKTIKSDMVQYAYKYYQKKENKDDLPQEDGSSTSITLKKLIQEGYMKEPAEAYNDESLKCSGEVFVENNNGNYLYTPYIECKSDNKDNNISTVYLKDKIIEDQLVESGVGLYAQGNTYIEKGEVKNNFVSIDDILYRIVRINEDGTIRLLSTEEITSTRWDNRYNENEKHNIGINDFINNNINSRINEKLMNTYNNNVSNKLKSLIVTQNLCIGKRSLGDTSKDGSTECSQTIKTQYGALAIYEYLQASLENQCVLPTDRICSNYNWLAVSDLSGWTITASADSTYEAYYINDVAGVSDCNSTDYVYPVFNISANTLYSKGTGKESDPYIIKYYNVGEDAKDKKSNKNSDE